MNLQYNSEVYDIEKVQKKIGNRIVNESKSQVINKMEPKPAFNH